MSHRTKAIFIASLLANLGLLVAYFSLDSAHAPSSATNTAKNAPAQPTSEDVAKFRALFASSADDEAAFVARLRSEKFPPHLLRAFVTAELGEHFAPQRHKIENTAGMDAYWRPFSVRKRGNPEAKAALRQLNRQESDQLRLLLGPDALPTYKAAELRRRFGNLISEKIQLIDLTNRDYDDMLEQVRSAACNVYLKEDQEKMAFLAKERQTDIASLLTPTEFADYQLRNSATAQNLQSKLTAFDATEQEYIALYNLHKNFDEKYNVGFPTLSSSAEQRKAQEQLNRDIETTLGADRYTTYKITTDLSFYTVHELVTGLSLPASTAKDVVGLKLEAVQRWNAIKQDATLTPADRETQIAALVSEAKDTLTQKLGEAGYTQYCKDEYISSWITRIAKSAAPAKP